MEWSSSQEDAALVKKRSSPVEEAAEMHRCSHEDKAVVMQRSDYEDEAEEIR